ncbi:hypothetical protein J437_LFUL017491 [Ladona fulva]|uniref:Cuticle protein n=1 Tax=Ladona fulva TaxID=123851 RepID=A0A8K0KL35_LADFU|nr:hypothetical protein J437_LFUL017491 [Ladona fulva]
MRSVLVILLLKTTDSAPRKPRLSIADWGDGYHEHGHQGEGTYVFGYDIDDPATGNTQYRNEERHANGSVTGSYGLVEPDGNVRVVHYIADANGFRVNIVNSEKPNAVFPAPTPALVPPKPTDTVSEASEKPPEIPEIPQQPEISNELPEIPMEISGGPSEQPELSFETPVQPSGEEAVESAQEEGNQVDQGGPPETIVLPGGIVIEIPPDGPDDDKLGPHTRFYRKKVKPALASDEVPSRVKYMPETHSPLQSILINPYSNSLNGYFGNRKHPYNAYPNYNPYLSFMAPFSYYSNNY